MTIKEIRMTFQNDKSNARSKIFTLLGVTVVFFVIFIGSLFYISGQGSRLTITKEEIAKEKGFIEQYRQDEQAYQSEFGAFAQPVKKNEIEIIQNDLIQKTKNYGLNVASLNYIASVAPPAPPKTNPSTNTTEQTQPKIIEGVEFEMGFVGTWENSVSYIQELQKGPGLLSIRNFSMKPKSSTNGASNLIETSLRYKIYLE